MSNTTSAHARVSRARFAVLDGAMENGADAGFLTLVPAFIEQVALCDHDHRVRVELTPNQMGQEGTMAVRLSRPGTGHVAHIVTIGWDEGEPVLYHEREDQSGVGGVIGGVVETAAYVVDDLTRV